MNTEEREIFRNSIYFYSFMPGDYLVLKRQCVGTDFPFHIHCSAKEPVEATFEYLFDNGFKGEIKVNITNPYHHAIGQGENNFDDFLILRRKPSKSKIPVFLLDIDGVFL